MPGHGRCERVLPRRLDNERGLVLLIVLIVISLLTIIVTEFTFSVEVDQHRTRNAIHALQSELLARSGVNLAEGFLMMDDDATYDAYSEDWWTQLDAFCKGMQLEESMRVRCRVRDESGKININNTRGVRKFTPPPAAGQQQPPASADAVLRDAVKCMFSRRNINLDYVDKLFDYWMKDPELKSDGTPQLIPDFTSLEDLGATLGIPNEQIHTLRNVLTAQPSRLLPRINVNTAPEEVLTAVLTDDAGAGCGSTPPVQTIRERQMDPDQPIKSNELATLITGIDNVDAKRRLFDVRSKMFRLEASGVTNIDPDSPDKTGIGQTLSVLVLRQQGAPHPGQQHTTFTGGGQQAQNGVGANGQPLPSWTLRPLDWQKEGGARLFRAAEEEDLLGSPEDNQDEDGEKRSDSLTRSMDR